MGRVGMGTQLEHGEDLGCREGVSGKGLHS